MYNPPPAHLALHSRAGRSMFRKFDLDNPATAAAVKEAISGPPPTFEDLLADAGEPPGGRAFGEIGSGRIGSDQIGLNRLRTCWPTRVRLEKGGAH